VGSVHSAIADAVSRGVVVRRARIISEPVSEYIRWEHYVTRANIEAGEQVRWLPRRLASDLSLPGNDFWAFDAERLRIHHFSGDGVIVEGVRSLITIHNADAAKEYRFDLNLPDGATTQQLDDGSVLVLKGDEPLGMFDAPWAKDANGAPVPTSYRVESGALIQTISFNEHTAFPVVADPWWNTVWKYTKCVAAVGAAFIPATKAYKAIKGLGGVVDAAKLLVKAGSVADFKRAAGGAALNILGVSAIQSNCF
jgi:hypothetical protein